MTLGFQTKALSWPENCAIACDKENVYAVFLQFKISFFIVIAKVGE